MALIANNVSEIRCDISDRRDIFFQILWESAMLNLAGCGAGLAVAMETSRLMARWADQPFVFDPSYVWLAAGSALGLNILSALIPAGTAARLDPIRALRFE